MLSITSKDCINIQEFAGEVFDGNNQNFLSLEDLRFIEKLVELFESIRNFDYKFYKKDDNFIIEHLREKLEPEENNLIKYINNCHEYERIFNENLNSNKLITETIQKILNKSEFFLMNSDIEFFNGFITEDENKPESINYDFLIELRDRAINNTYKKFDYNKKFKEVIDKEEEVIIKNNKIFIECVHQINELLKLIKRITKKGLLFKNDKIEELDNNNKKDIYSFLNKIENNFFLLKIKINISKKNDSYESKFYLNDEKKNSFKDINSYIDNLYKSLHSIQKNAYLTKNCINFIYGNQFQMIFDFLLSKKISKNLQHFLFGYFDNENIKINQENKKVLKVNLNQKFDLKTYKNFIEECDNFLLDIIKSNNLSLNDIYNKNLMKSDYNKYKGIYINGCSNLEKEIVQYYKLFTNNLPLSNTLLMCNEETTSEEIIAFLYRAIFCKKQICFCIAKPEELSKENKTLIKNLINEIFEGEIMLNIHQKMKASLFIMTKNLDDELCKSLFNFKFINLLLNIEGKNEQKIEDENIKIVHSDSSGVGKSTFIKAKAKNDYIYFPVGGVFSKEEILERFKELDEEKNINNMEDLLLHIVLYDTEQKSIMNDFLYFILVTKTIVKDINIFYLSRKIKIYLEIPKNFIDFFGKFSIITLIDEKFKIEIKLNDLPALIVPDNILSNERIVALYLKLLKEENILKEGVSPLLKAKNKIDKNEIVFEDINRDNILEGPEFDYNLIVIKAEDENKELTKDKCQKLIMEKLKECKIDNPNYYQINTFLKVLASQLVQFTRNKVLSVCTLIDSKKLDSCKIRSYIIQKFIDIT